MKNHKELFIALVNGEELVNTFNDKTLRLDDDGNAILMTKNWHNFNPVEWRFKQSLNMDQEDINNSHETKN
jgi:hypothetical protein